MAFLAQVSFKSHETPTGPLDRLRNLKNEMPVKDRSGFVEPANDPSSPIHDHENEPICARSVSR
jgi:hypothetical protein